jgi:DnaK suppressor protein
MLKPGVAMNDKPSALETTFLNRQKGRLLALQTQLASATQSDELEEGGVQDQSMGEAHEAEDDAQKLSLLETEGALISRNIQRLPLIQRALQKIQDGTYGFSDLSGRPIPRDRLEIMPEATLTADEEAGHRSGT